MRAYKNLLGGQLKRHPERPSSFTGGILWARAFPPPVVPPPCHCRCIFQRRHTYVLGHGQERLLLSVHVWCLRPNGCAVPRIVFVGLAFSHLYFVGFCRGKRRRATRILSVRVVPMYVGERFPSGGGDDAVPEGFCFPCLTQVVLCALVGGTNRFHAFCSTTTKDCNPMKPAVGPLPSVV